jgi:hypothetical protein
VQLTAEGGGEKTIVGKDSKGNRIELTVTAKKPEKKG